MRVLHIGKYFPPHRGGMETFIHDLMLEQADSGLEVTALVHSSEKTYKTRSETYRVDDVEIKITRVARWGTLFFVPISPSFCQNLSVSIRHFKPDVIHIHMPNASGLWLLTLPEARCIPWVVHWQSDVVTSSHKRLMQWLHPLYRIPEQTLLRHAQRIIATSPPYLSTSKALRNHVAKCVVVPLAIRQLKAPDISVPASYDKPVVPQDKLNVLTVCRLTYYKGVQYLLEAIAKTPNATLTLIGDGEERESLLQQSRKLGLQGRFFYIPDCSDEDLANHYQTHDIFCLPSIERTESFGIVLLEAMRMGLPCLVSDVSGSGMAWVVNAPHSGYVVRSADPIALATTLSNINNDRDDLATVGINASQRYRENFSMALCHGEILKIYQDAIKKLACFST